MTNDPIPASTDQPGSAYYMDHAPVADERATFAIVVDNEPGVLHRVVGLFAARGYNIESLTVAETDRRTRQDRQVRRTDAPAGPDGAVAHGRPVDHPRRALRAKKHVIPAVA